MVSEQIGGLEHVLGVKLFDRSHQAVRFITEGKPAVDLASAVMCGVGKLGLEESSRKESKGLATILLAIGKGMTERIIMDAQALYTEKVGPEIMEAKHAQRVFLVRTPMIYEVVVVIRTGKWK